MNFISFLSIQIEKIAVNVGMGESLTNKNAIESMLCDLTLITGQKPVVTKAKLSIANFSLSLIKLISFLQFSNNVYLSLLPLIIICRTFSPIGSAPFALIFFHLSFFSSSCFNLNFSISFTYR